jgi:hypothetical protein
MSLTKTNVTLGAALYLYRTTVLSGHTVPGAFGQSASPISNCCPNPNVAAKTSALSMRKEW